MARKQSRKTADVTAVAVIAWAGKPGCRPARRVRRSGQVKTCRTPRSANSLNCNASFAVEGQRTLPDRHCAPTGRQTGIASARDGAAPIRNAFQPERRVQRRNCGETSVPFRATEIRPWNSAREGPASCRGRLTFPIPLDTRDPQARVGRPCRSGLPPRHGS